MEVVPEPEKFTVAVIDLHIKPEFFYVNPYAGVRGGDMSGFDYSCGACGVVIVESSGRGRIIGMVFRCSKCRSYNMLRGS